MSRRRKRVAGPPSGPDWDRLYPTLDLHGLTADEAEAAAEAWLRRRRDEAEPLVRVVTGRGLHSRGVPVLPGAIADLLSRLKGEVVRDYEAEPGGGAFRVRLRLGRRAGGRGGPEKPAARDQALVRAAEEALRELGVTPTPVLVEAEIRRILRERAEERE